MIKKVFRPFWSYDVIKTEQWLSSMAERGYHFEKWNPFTRNFTFHQSAPQKVMFRIGYDKVQATSLSTTLLDEQWVKAGQSKHWYVLSNENPSASIKTFPVRETIIKHNRIIQYIFGAILLYVTATLGLFITVMGFTSSFQETPPKVVDSPLWVLTYIYMSAIFALWILSAYSVFQIHKSNKALISEHIQPYEIEQDQELTGQLVTIRRWGWMYAPDKLEKWLEELEEKGFNLYRVSKTGTTFYFRKGQSRKISYCALYQDTITQSYFDIHTGSGWKNSYASRSAFQNWSIWSREYTEGEERTHIYSEKSQHLKYAIRIAIIYSLLFLPIVSLQAYSLRVQIESILNDQRDSLPIIMSALLLISLLVLGMYPVRTWLYYMRIRKLYK